MELLSLFKNGKFQQFIYDERNTIPTYEERGTPAESARGVASLLEL